MLDQYEPILSVQETCEILMVGKNTIYDLIKSNRIIGFRTGRTWKIDKNSLIDFIKKESNL